MQTIKDILDRAAGRTRASTTAGVWSSNPPEEMPSFEEGPDPPKHCICKGLGWYRENVDFGHPWFGKAFPCVCILARHQKRYASWLWTEARLPERFAEKSLEDFDTRHPGNAKARAAAVKFITGELETPWLAFVGIYGNGKTHLLAAIVRSFVGRGVHAVYGYVPSMLKELQAAMRPEREQARYDEVLASWQRMSVLALDDLGVEQSTPWTRSTLEELIDYRYRECLPTVIATNQDVADLSPRIARRIGDRRACTVVVNDAPQWRDQPVHGPWQRPEGRSRDQTGSNHDGSPASISAAPR